jgi:hypothetical protein
VTIALACNVTGGGDDDRFPSRNVMRSSNGRIR